MSSPLSKLFSLPPSKALPLIIVIITVMLLLLFKFLQPVPPVKVKEEKSWLVQTTFLLNGAKSPQLELYGQVESPYTATITSNITADVKSLDIREGEVVNKDQLLLELDDADIHLIVDQRQSDVAELEAMITSEKNRHKNNLASLKLEKSLVALAEKKLKREEKTSRTNLTSQSSFDSQKQALQNQKLALKARQLNVTDHPARLAQLEARLKHKQALAQQAEKDLQRSTVVAPFDGIVLKTYVAPGERVRPGEQLLKIYSTENVELRAQLPQRFISSVKQALDRGMILTGMLKTGNGNFAVSLHRLSGTMADTGNGVDALFEIESTDARRLLIGEVHEIVVSLPALQDVYRIPISSIYGTNRIYQVIDGRLQAVNVEKMGNLVEDDRQYLLVRSDELKDGDEIIITQLPHAISGLKVDVNNASDSETR
ncbi:MAG: HlyD family efflux transporter periplasmic adaptor subunit [Proteobacteria bacterium]|nr:HlyD family efflux transporter periplasmic adaptor subunit [Pseudomonadota bacterium]